MIQDRTSFCTFAPMKKEPTTINKDFIISFFLPDGMRRELVYLSSHATKHYFIPNWGSYYLFIIHVDLRSQVYRSTRPEGLRLIWKQHALVYELLSLRVVCCLLAEVEYIMLLYKIRCSIFWKSIKKQKYYFFAKFFRNNLLSSKLCITFAPANKQTFARMAGQLSWLERRIHNPEVPGSQPGPATKKHL